VKKLYAADRNWPTFVYQGPVSPGSHLALYTSKKIHSHNTGYCARPLRNNLENKRATIDAKLAFMAKKNGYCCAWHIDYLQYSEQCLG